MQASFLIREINFNFDPQQIKDEENTDKWIFGISF